MSTLDLAARSLTQDPLENIPNTPLGVGSLSLVKPATGVIAAFKKPATPATPVTPVTPAVPATPVTPAVPATPVYQSGPMRTTSSLAGGASALGALGTASGAIQSTSSLSVDPGKREYDKMWKQQVSDMSRQQRLLRRAQRRGDLRAGELLQDLDARAQGASLVLGGVRDAQGDAAQRASQMASLERVAAMGARQTNYADLLKPR